MKESLIEFTLKEIKFLKSIEEARIATCHDNLPHVKPVSFIFDDNIILVATDYDTRTFQNIKSNPKVAIVIDIYKQGAHQAICIQGKVAVIEEEIDFDKTFEMFFKKFKWVRDDPWKQGEAPFLKIIPDNKTSWGIN